MEGYDVSESPFAESFSHRWNRLAKRWGIASNPGKLETLPPGEAEKALVPN